MSDNQMWYASDAGIEQVTVDPDNKRLFTNATLSDGTIKKIRRSSLFDDEKTAYTNFLKKLKESNTAISNRNKERYNRYVSFLGPDTIRDIFTLRPEEPTEDLVNAAKQQNSIKSFFSDAKIKSFDVEATGLDTNNRDLNKRARIWQSGLAIDGEVGVEKHTNPLKEFLGNVTEPNPKAIIFKGDIKEKLRTSNGRFSEDTYTEGGFERINELHSIGRLPNLDKSIQSTLGQVSNRDIVVLQNMNYENKILKSSAEQGLLSEDVYNQLLGNMYTTGNESDGFKSILQRPSEVQRQMRRADVIYNTQFLVTGSDGAYNEYLGHLNNTVAAYKDVINNPNRTKAVAVELQDITKYFLANAANRGFIDKNKSTLGLNVEFLSKAILGEKEKHTALSDATQTITLMKKMMVMGEELESGNISDETKTILGNIKEAHKTEVDRGFLSSVASMLHDMKTKKSFNLNSSFSYYAPESRLIEDGKEVVLDKQGTTSRNQTRNIDEALDAVVDRYSVHGTESINREGYAETLKEQFKKTGNVNKLHETAEEDLNSFKKNGGKIKTNVAPSSTKLEVGSLKKYAGIAAAAGLAYMWLTPDPGKKQHDYSSVSQDYYDDQYLGTEFVNYKERNKHYMM